MHIGTARKTAGSSATNDEELLDGIARGGEEPLATLYARHAPAVFGMASRALDPAAAEEIVQDVFVAVWRGASSFDPSRGEARAWLYQIARHRIANELRRRGRRPRTAGDDEALADVPDSSPDQAESFWRKHRTEVLRRALRTLPPAERAALGLAYFEELPHRELAASLGIPLGTAKSRIRSAVGRLRASLGPLVAVLCVGILVTLVARRNGADRKDLARDERALAMLTSSDALSLRLGAAPGQAAATHATYRFRPGSPIAVVTFSSFPIPAAGQTDRAWALVTGRWIPLGAATPDASGRARLIAENPALAGTPERLVVTRETGPRGLAPAGNPVVEWEPDRK